MTPTTAQFILGRLAPWGARRVCGLDDAKPDEQPVVSSAEVLDGGEESRSSSARARSRRTTRSRAATGCSRPARAPRARSGRPRGASRSTPDPWACPARWRSTSSGTQTLRALVSRPERNADRVWRAEIEQGATGPSVVHVAQLVAMAPRHGPSGLAAPFPQREPHGTRFPGACARARRQGGGDRRRGVAAAVPFAGGLDVASVPAVVATQVAVAQAARR